MFIECRSRCLGHICEQKDQHLAPCQSCLLEGALRSQRAPSETRQFRPAGVNTRGFRQSRLALLSPSVLYSEVSTSVPKITLDIAGLASIKCYHPQYTELLYQKFLGAKMIKAHICIG